MDYEREFDFNGDPEKALEHAQQVFSQHGFAIENVTRGGFEASRSGMVKKGEHALTGASYVSLAIENRRLRATAEFGGHRKTIGFVVVLIASMSVFFVVLFGYLSFQTGGFSPLNVLWPFAPWPILIPLLAVVTRQRTQNALDRLVSNMCAVSGAQPPPEREQSVLAPFRYVLYGVGGLMIAAGSILFPVMLFGSIGAMTENAFKVVVPGEHALELGAGGTYTIFHEFVGVVDGKRYETRPNLGSLRVRLTDAETGETITLVDVPPSSSYTRMSDVRGQSVFRFDIHDPGTYTLSAAYRDGAAAPKTVLSIARWQPANFGLGLAVPPGLVVGGVLIVMLGREKR